MALGTTIDGLNTVTSLTAQDEVPVWDKEASGEPTKKITAANLASSVKTLANLQGALTFDTQPKTTSTNPVTSAGIAVALNNKQNTLTFDTAPTDGSTNPVTSGGTYTAIQQSTATAVNDLFYSDTAKATNEARLQYNGLKFFKPRSAYASGWVLDLQGRDANDKAIRIGFDKTGGIYCYYDGVLQWHIGP